MCMVRNISCCVRSSHSCVTVVHMQFAHVSGVLGREDCIGNLLVESGVAPTEICNAEQVRPVLRKLLASHPRWLCLQLSGASVATVINPSVNFKLAQKVQEWMPVEVKTCCGQACCRWRVLPARFVILAAGVLHGQIVCLRQYRTQRILNLNNAS